MNSLVAFEENHLKKFSIKSDLLFFETNKIRLQVDLQNPLDEIQIQSQQLDKLSFEVPRENELWKSTCFEFFLKPIHEKKYYEFNISLKPAWNVYVFDDYRTPQPPMPSSEFAIESLSFQSNQLKAQFKNLSPYQNFNVGLTAVIKDQNEQMSYWALKHSELKPDFHSINSFQLQRGF